MLTPEGGGLVLNLKKLLTKMLKTGTRIDHTGSKSVANTTITNLVAEFTLPETGVWLVLADVDVTTTGSSSANLQNRLFIAGVDKITQEPAIKNFHVFSMGVITSGTVKLDTFQNTGSTQTIRYELTCLRII